MYRAVVAYFLRGAGLSSPGRRVHDLVEVAEICWLRRLSFEARRPEEGWTAYHRRRRARELHARRTCEAYTAWERMCRLEHSLCGHIARRP